VTDRDPGDRGDRSDGGSEGAARPSVALAAGAALFNEGHPLAARDVWETAGRSHDGSSAERLFGGLAATAAATHRSAAGEGGDADEAAEHAKAAVASLEGVSDSHGVRLSPVREWADHLATAPRNAGEGQRPRIGVNGEAPRFDGLSLDAAGVAAPALARAGEPGDAATLAAAAEFAAAERGTGRSRFAELLFAYLRTPGSRPQVAARLGDHVAIEERKRRDVDDLF
jgi:hypothetical protein